MYLVQIAPKLFIRCLSVIELRAGTAIASGVRLESLRILLPMAASNCSTVTMIYYLVLFLLVRNLLVIHLHLRNAKRKKHHSLIEDESWGIPQRPIRYTKDLQMILASIRFYGYLDACHC